MKTEPLSRQSLQEKLYNRLQDKMPFLKSRADLTDETRAFFKKRGYQEVETPYLTLSPGEEVHLQALKAEVEDAEGNRQTLRLHTSPEFAMKKLLAAGSGPIFQLARVWRNKEGSKVHKTEFTMLEWYRPGADMLSLLDETEIFMKTVLPPEITFGGKRNLTDKFERLTVQEAFLKYWQTDILNFAGDAEGLAKACGVKLRAGETWEDLFFRLMMSGVEPFLGADRPTFLTHWPVSQAALAKKNPADLRTALRFELYICGLEVANAFEELTDAVEQRERFTEDRARRLALNREADWPLDEDFLQALSVMPQASGIAVGFDRLALLRSGARSVDDVLWTVF